MSVYYFRCEEHEDHLIALDMNDSELPKLLKLMARKKRVCPSCNAQEPPVHNRLHQVEAPTHNGWFDRCVRFACRHGHITEFTAFTNGMINVSWIDADGDDIYYNIEGGPEEIRSKIASGSIKCGQMKISEKNGKISECKCKMKQVDEENELEVPTHTVGIKTKVRVGDVWDKAGVPEPRVGGYEGDKGGMDYKETEFDRRQGRRMSDMRKGTIEVFDDKSGKLTKIKRERNNELAEGTKIVERKKGGKI